MSAMDSIAIYRRDRRVVLAGLVGITALSWAYLTFLASHMSVMPMLGMAMPQWRPWGVVDFSVMLLMWVVMMVPSASPMILASTTLHRRRLPQEDAAVPTTAFFAGYAIMWSAFSLTATLAQWGLHRAALLSPTMVSTSPVLGGLPLV